MNIITSPVEKWPGGVAFKSPIPLADVLKLERAIREAQQLGEAAGQTEFDAVLLPGLLACVDHFELEGLPADVTEETFPGVPRVASARLIAFLTTEIMKMYRDDGGGDDVPLD